MTVWWSILAGCVSLLAERPSVTRVTLDQEFRDIPYPVRGSNWVELMKSVHDQAALMALPNESGRQFTGHAHWKIRWNETAKSEPSGCILSIELTLSGVTMLPEWAPPPDASAALLSRWDRWLESLRAHELGHRQISIDMGEKLRDAAGGLRARPRCETDDPVLDRLGRGFTDAAEARQAHYDEITDHGATQAAWLGLATLLPRLPEGLPAAE